MSRLNYEINLKFPEAEKETVHAVLVEALYSGPLTVEEIPTKTPGVMGLTVPLKTHYANDVEWPMQVFARHAFNILHHPQLNYVPVHLYITSEITGISLAHQRILYGPIAQNSGNIPLKSQQDALAHQRILYGPIAQNSGNIPLKSQQDAFDNEEHFWPEQLAQYRKAKMKQLVRGSV